MNRIRRVGDIYEVLVTPNITFDSDMELIAGNWTDPYLKGFYIKDFDNEQDAYYFSATMPDMDWMKLIRMNKDFKPIVHDKVEKILDSHGFTYNIETVLMTPVQLKNTIFDRVKNSGKRFTLASNLNDVLTVIVTNPWYNNLEDMAQVLKKVHDLRIKKIIRKNKTVTLVGVNHMGTSYEIKLMPTLIRHAIEWKDNNVHNSSSFRTFIGTMNELLKLQKKIDKETLLR